MGGGKCAASKCNQLSTALIAALVEIARTALLGREAPASYAVNRLSGRRRHQQH